MIAAMAQAIEAAEPHPYARAEAALDVALRAMLNAWLDHGIAEGMNILNGRDPRQEAAHAALRGMDAAE